MNSQIPASPPAADEHGVVPLSMQADVDSELEQVFGDVGSLPTMVTPVCDLDGGPCVTPAECPVIEPPDVSVVVTRWSTSWLIELGRRFQSDQMCFVMIRYVENSLSKL